MRSFPRDPARPPPRRGRVGAGLLFAAALALALATAGSAADGHPASVPEVAADGPAHHEDPAPEAGGDHRDHGNGHGHADAEGVKLVAATGESVVAGRSCGPDATRRDYDIVALPVEITLNRYLDHDPEGRMYALAADVDAIRAEEAANAAARAGRGDPAVSPGLQGDAIQPLTLRVLPGECLVVTLENRLDEPASFHLHGSSLRVAATGAPAVAANPDALAAPGGSVVYEWMVPVDQPEATHYFHSHGNERAQTAHGLFGALVVEPAGSRWLDPLTGQPTETGWQAVIQPPGAPTFREFTLYYHEIGNENYRLRDAAGLLVAIVDPITSAYRPGARTLNYRSEPFMNRLALARERTGTIDKSLAYSSYAFGDPATPMPRAYVGEPVKQRVVHGGSEVFHVHHVHGGGTRWPRQPGVEGSTLAAPGGDPLVKRPPATPGPSERTDSQSLGPSETFDIAPECTAGGCQQAVGDFMYHCHVAHHYFAGMWGLARTYNTLQDGVASTDDLPPFAPLPELADAIAPAVPTDALIATTVDGKAVTAASLAALVESQLPPRGVPADGDASVLDWVRDGQRYLGEPQTAQRWPGHEPSAPGQRPALLVDPRTGRLAYPTLRPQFAKRPPFAPGHGPAPFLDPDGNRAEVPAVGAAGPASVCPSGTRLRSFNVNAVRTPVRINARGNILDPYGMLFVLREERDRLGEDRALQVPLALRANAGRDCVDVLLRSELPDDAITPMSKVGVHIHFVQFDVQASDGVNVGFNYEQTVRPYAAEGARLLAAAPSGATVLRVDDAARLRPGALVGVGMDVDERFEIAEVAAVDGTAVRLTRPLRHPHERGEFVSAEFVRYRWFPDAQFGTAYFHDHVDALTTWQHGLFGALVGEPADATWTHPQTGEQVRSGPIADIHTDEPVGHDVRGSFRELLLFTQDDNPRVHVRRSTGGTLNLRAEPLAKRPGAPELRFHTPTHGDPETPLLRAHLGDPVVVRDLVGGANEIHTLHVDGHWFRAERFSATSPPVAAIDVGISERYDLVIPAAGGPQRKAGDYLYESGRPAKLEEGNWGLLRVLPPGDPSLRALPRRAPAADASQDICPADAPVRRFAVAAVEAPLPMFDGAAGRVFTDAASADAVASGERPAEPLVLRVGVGDCLEVELRNQLAQERVSLRSDLLARDPATSAGVAAGREPDQSVAPGASRSYRLYASPEVGQTVALVRDGADVLGNVRRGLYGAVVVGPAGARFRDPATGASLDGRSSWRADVHPPDGGAYRDVALFLHDEDELIGSHKMPYTTRVRGATAVNYRSEPLDGRSVAEAVADGPSTPVIEAVAGDRLRVHVLAPWSEQAQVFALEGHTWPQEPGLVGTPQLSSRRIGGLQALTLQVASAGGPQRLAGEYRYGNHRGPHAEAGAWGILRVTPAAGQHLRPLAARGGLPSVDARLLALAAALLASALLARAAWIWRRRRSG